MPGEKKRERERERIETSYATKIMKPRPVKFFVNMSMEEQLLPMKAAKGSSPTPSSSAKVPNLPNAHFVSSQDTVSPANSNQPIIHRSLSAPSRLMTVCEASLGSCDDVDGGGALMTAPSAEPSFVMFATVGLVLYLASGVSIYAAERASFDGRRTTSTVADGLYFSVVTLCTIGYGDVVPRTAFAKLFTCTFALFGFGFVYVLLNGLVAHVLDRQERALLGMVGGERPAAALRTYVMDVRKGRMRVRMKVGLAVAVVVGCIAVGAAMARLLEGLGWVDSLYLSVTSVTTVGYGDVTFETERGRLFATAWLLVSTLAVARAFLYLTELRMEKRHREVARWVLHKKMTSSDMVAADLDRDGSISKSEYVIYKLKEMGTIAEKDIMPICEQFDRLDKGNCGKITLSDLIESHH